MIAEANFYSLDTERNGIQRQRKHVLLCQRITKAEQRVWSVLVRSQTMRSLRSTTSVAVHRNKWSIAPVRKQFYHLIYCEQYELYV
jgi:hypothetical protein